MTVLFSLLVMIWAVCFVVRLAAQADNARIAVAEYRLAKKPPFWELLVDATLWPLWLTFDLGRWIKKKVWR